MSLLDEIHQQPGVLDEWLATQWNHTREIADAIRARNVEFVFLAARGTSDHAGVYAQYVWGSLNRLPVAFAAPSLFTRYGDWPRLSRALVVGISQSGQSPDIVSVIAEGRKQGALTLAITNVKDSPLALSAEFALDVHAGVEYAVAATKTYTAQLMAIAALSAALSENEGNIRALWQAPRAAAQALLVEEDARHAADARREMSRAVVLGRGYNYSTAMEWALKLKELAYVFADPYSTADFQHGPIAIVERDFPVLAIAPGGKVLPDVLQVLRRLRDAYGASILTISDDASARALGERAIRLPDNIPEWLMPLVCIIPAQLFCYYLTRAKGIDPDAPRGLTKVTLTE